MNNKKIVINLNDELYETVKKESEKQCRTVSNFIINAVEKKFEKEKLLNER